MRARVHGILMGLLVAVAVLGTIPATAEASAWSGTYEVTITNLTRGQSFTPFLAASHTAAMKLFELGDPASAEVQAIAEGGDTGPLADKLDASPRVHDIQGTGGLIFPGESMTFTISARYYDRISLLAMLLPTNDGFVALSGADLPRRGRSVQYYAKGYDAGTERNDESCDSIPGPMLPFPGPNCGAGGAPGGGEGYVHVHAGIHGVGDLAPAERDWKNPVARVTIRRVR